MGARVAGMQNTRGATVTLRVARARFTRSGYERTPSRVKNRLLDSR